MALAAFPWPLPLIADGAPCSALEPGRPPGAAPVETLNLDAPEQVQAVHAAFREAGATLHRTNTRHAHRVALLPLGLAARGEAINNSASALLRAAIGPEGLMMGAIAEMLHGPAGEPAGETDREQGYGEQVVYLADTGVTFILLEHFTRVEEALRVIRIVRSASDAPVLAQLRFDGEGRTGEGLDAAEAARRLVAGGADALGLGCGPAPSAWPALLEALLAPGVPVGVLAGIQGEGLPPPYPGAPRCSPEQFADTLAPLAAQGIAILGGCCGVTPAHIRALAARVQAARP